MEDTRNTTSPVTEVTRADREEGAHPVAIGPSSHQRTLDAMTPSNMAEAVRFAEVIAKSAFVGQQYQGKPENVMVAMQIAAQWELPLLTVLQNVAVINSKPAAFGDLLLALARRSPMCDSVDETFDEASTTATCSVRRRGQREPVTRSFSKADAEKAKLWGKAGPWTQYPRRMLQMRARSWALRDALPEALLGIIAREEAEDIKHATVEQRTQVPEPLPPTKRDKTKTVGEELVDRLRRRFNELRIDKEEMAGIAHDALGFVPESLGYLDVGDLQKLSAALDNYREEPGADG